MWFWRLNHKLRSFGLRNAWAFLIIRTVTGSATTISTGIQIGSCHKVLYMLLLSSTHKILVLHRLYISRQSQKIWSYCPGCLYIPSISLLSDEISTDVGAQSIRQRMAWLEMSCATQNTYSIQCYITNVTTSKTRGACSSTHTQVHAWVV